ncbi:hypothetical protein ACLB2K_050603 [Fragaria x ananassa]
MVSAIRQNNSEYHRDSNAEESDEDSRRMVEGTLDPMVAEEWLLQMKRKEMSLADYQSKFEELMRFSPGIILNEAAKAKKFEDGLDLQIKEKVSILKLQTYLKVVDRALIVEQSILGSKPTLEPTKLDEYPRVSSPEYHRQ